jgi:hypothetical protein
VRTARRIASAENVRRFIDGIDSKSQRCAPRLAAGGAQSL